MSQALPHIFIISLPEAEERRAEICSALNKLKLEHSIFEGVDGRGFDVTTHPDYDRDNRLKYFGRDLLGGEIGCFLSHKHVMEKIIADDLPYAVVLEDDAVVLYSLPPVLNSLVSMNKVPDFVRFLGSKKVNNSKHTKIAKLTDEIDLTVLRTTPGGAHGYFITKEGALKLLKHMDKIFIPIDTLMGYSWQTGVDNLATIPSPILHGKPDDSMIGHGRFNKEIKVEGLDKTLFPLRRACFKTKENVMKSLSYAKASKALSHSA